MVDRMLIVHYFTLYYWQILIFKICFSDILKNCIGLDVDNSTAINITRSFPWILSIFLQLILEVGKKSKVLKYSRLDEIFKVMIESNQALSHFTDYCMLLTMKLFSKLSGFISFSLTIKRLKNKDPDFTIMSIQGRIHSFEEFRYLSDENVVQLANLLEGNTSVRTICITSAWNNLSIKGYAAFADCLNINKSIQSIRLDCTTSIQDDCIHVLAASIKHSNKLKEFHVKYWGGLPALTLTALEAIVDAIQYSASLAEVRLQCLLQQLSEDDVIRYDSKITLLVQQLNLVLQQNTSLQLLSLESSKKLFSNINTGVVFMNGLRANISLKTLDVSNCNIGNDGIIELANSIRYNNAATSLKNLILKKNAIDDTGAVELFHVLQINQTIEHLMMKGNNISNTSTVVLADSLYWNTSLKSIDLSCNNVSEKGAVALAKSIRYNPSIKVLDMTYNPINEYCVQCFTISISFNETIEKLSIGCMDLDISPELEQILINVNDPKYFLRYNTTFIKFLFHFKNLTVYPTEDSVDYIRQRRRNNERIGHPRRCDIFAALLSKEGCIPVKQTICK